MTENTMRDAFEKWYANTFLIHIPDEHKQNYFRQIGGDYLSAHCEGASVGYQAAIAQQNQDAVPIYQAANRGQWMDISLQNFIVHTGIKRIVYLAPPQPQEVADALEEAAKICDDRIKKIEIAINEENDENEDITLKSTAWQFLVTASEIRALIK